MPVQCAGNCGKLVVAVQADDCAQQQGPWYCERCFEIERKRREAQTT